jgi:hypothetical protein
MGFSPGFIADRQDAAEIFHLVRGSKKLNSIELPWLDIDQAIFIAINRIPGDDIAIVLDYRTDRMNPRVVASDWWSGEHGCVWKEVSGTFSDFVKALRLTNGLCNGML